MILAISDVHLGYDLGEKHHSNREDFLQFLDSYPNKRIDHLVLLGDFFDFWRANNAHIVEENKDLMDKLNNLNAKEIHYIAGNHDYYILDLNGRYESNKKINYSTFLRLKDNGNSFFFIHGYELESILWEFPASLEVYEKFSKEMCFNKDTSGSIMSRIWSGYENIKRFKKRQFKKDMDRHPSERNLGEVEKLARSTGKYPLLGMEPNEYLVFGHTHRPFIDEENKVVNTGSWINDIEEDYQQNSYVEIENGAVNLKYFK